MNFNLIIIPQEKAGISIGGVSDRTIALRGETIYADILVEKTQGDLNLQILKLDLSDVNPLAAEIPGDGVELVNEDYLSKYKYYRVKIIISPSAQISAY